jgi:hypothetical protein
VQRASWLSTPDGWCASSTGSDAHGNAERGRRCHSEQRGPTLGTPAHCCVVCCIAIPRVVRFANTWIRMRSYTRAAHPKHASRPCQLAGRPARPEPRGGLAFAGCVNGVGSMSTLLAQGQPRAWRNANSIQPQPQARWLKEKDARAAVRRVRRQSGSAVRYLYSKHAQARAQSQRRVVCLATGGESVLFTASMLASVSFAFDSPCLCLSLSARSVKLGISHLISFSPELTEAFGSRAGGCERRDQRLGSAGHTIQFSQRW